MKSLSINIVFLVVFVGFTWYMASSNTSYNLRKACIVVPHQSFPEFLVLIVEGICTSEEGLAQ